MSNISRRRFIGLLASAAALLAAPLLARQQPRWLPEPFAASPDMRSLLGVQILPDVREPLPSAPLGIERWQSWANHVAGPIEPARLISHREDTRGEVPRGDRVDDERLLGLIAGAKPESHAGTGSRRRESLDLRQAGPFDFGDGLRPAVECAIPSGDMALVEDGHGHPSAPSVGVPRIVAELTSRDTLPASALVEI